jgi:hypothetical protein
MTLCRAVPFYRYNYAYRPSRMREIRSLSPLVLRRPTLSEMFDL